jgi:GMP synthase-like glutamine amidotransferase
MDLQIKFFCYVIFTILSLLQPGVVGLNYRPIIGILSQDLSYDEAMYGPSDATSYIAASYIKFVEAGGARAAPVIAGRSEEYYQTIFSQINGILLPGGGSNISTVTSSNYSSAANTLYQLAAASNAAGDYFPVWATCLGFELLSVLEAGGTNVLTSCSADNMAMPIIPTENFNTSRLFSALPSDVYDYLLNYNSTANFHTKCLTTKNVTATQLLEERIGVLSLNYDSNGLQFISSFEDVTRPFYGTQWHPEKPMFEWNVNNTGIPHTWEGVRAGQHLANFFVQEARKNNHVFDNQDDENAAMIYNYQPVDTAQYGGYFDQLYFFN